MIKNTYSYGLFAEYFVILFLTLKGYRILARRYKTHFGEIDIIVRKKQRIIAFEVKARKNKESLTSDIFTNTQRNRIKNAMNLFLSKNPKYIDYNISFNIVLFANIFNFQILEGYF